MVKIRLAALTAVLISATSSAFAETNAGAYLAGRHAVVTKDFETAATYFNRALARDASNVGLMESVVRAQLGLGQLERALPVAQKMERAGVKSQTAHMIVVGDMVQRGDFNALRTRDFQDRSIGPLVDGLLLAWAHFGDDDLPAALAQFDALGQENGLDRFAALHKALALAAAGDFAASEKVFQTGADAPLSGISRRAAIARAEVLSQLGRNDEALTMLIDAFGAGFDPALNDVADQLKAGKTLPLTITRNAADGVAEIFHSVAHALRGQASDEYVLVYSRMATALRPDHIDAILQSAEILEDLRQYDLAVETYKNVPQGSPDHHAAELGRAEALRRSDKPDAAIEVLEQLAGDYPTLPNVHSALGDLFRQQENYARAVSAYDKALEFTEKGARSEWFLHYARGISHEREKNWANAESDFRAALVLNPDQPQVLNYLGYSLVERQEKLDEALDLIERAVAARPDSGYIVDSLGWVLYRLGRYEEAVEHMERAVALLPVDPVVNDHLGDVYWAVGRLREADFQWKRALSFIDPEDTNGEADPDRIRRKIEAGLDFVLQEEGSPPLKVAQD